MKYCFNCDNEATHIIEETQTPICETCKMAYELGRENQGTIVEIEEK